MHQPQSEASRSLSANQLEGRQRLEGLPRGGQGLPAHRTSASLASISSLTRAGTIDEENDESEAGGVDEPVATAASLLPAKKKKKVTITLKRIYATSDTPGRVVAVLSQPMPSPLEKFYANKPPIPRERFLSASDPSLDAITHTPTSSADPVPEHRGSVHLLQKASHSTPEIIALIRKLHGKPDHQRVAKEDGAELVDHLHGHGTVPSHGDNNDLPGQSISKARRDLPTRSKSDVIRGVKLLLSEKEDSNETCDVVAGIDDDDVFLPPVTQQPVTKASTGANIRASRLSCPSTIV